MLITVSRVRSHWFVVYYELVGLINIELPI